MRNLIAVTLALVSAQTAILTGSGAVAQPSGQAPAARKVAGTMVGPALYVTDVAQSLKFYRDGLGMQVRMQFGPPNKPDVVIGFGSDPSQPGIMLLSDRTPAGPAKIHHVHGFDRIAFLMTDLPAVAAKLRSLGFKADEIREVHGTHLMMMTTDPDGYRFELLQPKPAT